MSCANWVTKWDSFFLSFVKIGFLKNFENLSGKYLRWGPILVKLQVCFAATLLKRDSKQVFSCKIC